MYLLNSANQLMPAMAYRADGVSTGAAQLVLPVVRSRANLFLQNISDTAMSAEKGPARAYCTISGGIVNAVTMENAGFNYTLPPNVRVYGGGANTIVPPSWNRNRGQVQWEVPSGPAGRPATFRATVSGGAVSIAIIDGGAGYVNPPQLFLENDPRDPFGCAVPSATSGFILVANGGAMSMNGIAVDTSQIAIFCSGSGKNFTCEYML